MTLARLAVIAALPALALVASAASAQSLPPGMPPSLGAEIDEMLRQAPGGAPRAPGSRETVGQEVDRLMGQTAPGATSRRNVRAGIQNRTRHTIRVVQITPVDRGEWTPNLLRERFNPGVTLTWRVNDGCRYDVRVTFDEDNEFSRFNHDFCAQERIMITAIDAEPLPERRERVVLYRLTNDTGAVVYTVHATPTGARAPGPDLLGAWVMAQGDHYTGRVARSLRCTYDLRITFDVRGTDVMTLPSQNLCETPDILLTRRAGPQG
jgi:hypothetical protein